MDFKVAFVVFSHLAAHATNATGVERQDPAFLIPVPARAVFRPTHCLEFGLYRDVVGAGRFELWLYELDVSIPYLGDPTGDESGADFCR